MPRRLGNCRGPTPATFCVMSPFLDCFLIRFSQSLVPLVSERRGRGLVWNPRLCDHACSGHVASFL